MTKYEDLPRDEHAGVIAEKIDFPVELDLLRPVEAGGAQAGVAHAAGALRATSSCAGIIPARSSAWSTCWRRSRSCRRTGCAP